MRTVMPLDSSASSSSRLRLWKDSLTDVPAADKMGLEVAESLLVVIIKYMQTLLYMSLLKGAYGII